MIKLIASDLDGTLLLNGAQDLTREALELIHRLSEEKHIFFVAASGRQLFNIRNLFYPVRDEIGYICENGCISYLFGEQLHMTTMDRETGQELMKEILDFPGAEVLLSGLHTSYIQPKDMSYYEHLRYVVRNHVTVTDDILDTPEEYFKIALYEKDGVCDRHIDYWKKRYSDRLHVVTGGNSWLDFMPEGVGKQTGIEPILKRLGIAPDECIMFGDNENDRELLDYVGFPVMMSSAAENLKKAYPLHTDTVEAALKQILLNC